MDGLNMRKRQQSFVDIIKEIMESECYFRGLSSHEQVVQLLRNEDDGTFLVRDKLTTQHGGVLALSVKFLLPGEKSYVWHLNIVCEGGMVNLSHDTSRRFESFRELVRHYKIHPIIVGSGSKIYLRRHLVYRPALPSDSAIGRAPVPLPRSTRMPIKSQELSSQQAAVVLQRHMNRIHASVAGHELHYYKRGERNATHGSHMRNRFRENPELLNFQGGDYIASLLGFGTVDEGAGGNEETAVNDDCGTDRCDCGINFEDAMLPSGWTMHISHEPDSCGRLFFKNPDNVATWTLPEEILDQMTEIEERKFRRRMAMTAPMSDGIS